ncbi:MAG: hypothetical protein K2P64_00285 [Lachnospiraceae bacterium]|nr:hypothetical protein [Lachnospiraceae bacterium]
MKYMKTGKTYMVLFTISIAAILSIAVFFYFKDVNELEAIEKGDYSHLDSERTQEALEKRDCRDFTWIYRDINGDGEEELIVQDDSAANSILFILSMENDEVVTVFSDLTDMGCYTQLCDNGLLYYDRYYGVYDYELYILYYYDKEWNMKFVEGLELYYIEKPEEGVKSKGSGKLNMGETGLYFWNFKIHDGERVYTKLTQEEWIEKFQDLFGKECEGYIFERYFSTY